MGALGGTICDPVLEWSLEVMVRNRINEIIGISF